MIEDDFFRRRAAASFLVSLDNHIDAACHCFQIGERRRLLIRPIARKLLGLLTVVGCELKGVN